MLLRTIQIKFLKKLKDAELLRTIYYSVTAILDKEIEFEGEANIKFFHNIENGGEKKMCISYNSSGLIQNVLKI